VLLTKNFADPRQITENKQFLARSVLSYVWLLSKFKSFIGVPGEILLRTFVRSYQKIVIEITDWL
jgi:hypothetical protein